MKNSFILISTAFLITGQLIGAGILGIPVVAGLAGLIPALTIMLIYGFAMFFSAVLLGKEAVDKADPIFNFPSLYQEHLGKFVKWIAIVINMLMLYGLLVAYTAGGSIIISGLFNIPEKLSWIVVLAFFILLTGFTTMGVAIVRKYNVLLILGLWISFSIIIIMGTPHINPAFFKRQSWLLLPLSIPVVVTSFNFCNLLPVVSRTLKWNMSLVWKAIFIGMIVALLMNASWVLIGIGIIPLHGSTNSLVSSYINNDPTTLPMAKIMLKPAFLTFALIFSIIAITTSFITVGLSLISFNKDLVVNFVKGRGNRLVVLLLTFIPPLLITMKYPHIFIKALGITGGICTICLFGILPAVIAIKKYSFKIKCLGALSFILFLSALTLQMGLELGLIHIGLP